MELSALVAATRSVRRYTGEPVAMADLRPWSTWPG